MEMTMASLLSELKIVASRPTDLAVSTVVGLTLLLDVCEFGLISDRALPVSLYRPCGPAELTECCPKKNARAREYS